MLQAKTPPSPWWAGLYLPRRMLVLVPALGLVVIICLLMAGNLLRTVSGGVPVESLTVEETRVRPGEIDLRVRNDGRVPATISQVSVDDAYQPFTIGDRNLDHLEGTTIKVQVPWEEAVPVHFTLVTSTGTVFDHEIPSPALTPVADSATVGTLTVIGLAMAAVPVVLGLLWLPALRRSSPKIIAAAMAFTLGLLSFLLVDTVAEGLEHAGALGSGLNGTGLFALGALGAMALLAMVDPHTRRAPDRDAPSTSARSRTTVLQLTWLVAIGIGMHNLGEGLAVGTAMRVGDLSLGAALVVGFAVHNLTEGLAIASALSTSDSKVRLGKLALLGAAAGLPAVPGLWLGGLVGGGVWAVLGLGAATGAIAQVLWSVGRFVLSRGSVSSPLAVGSFAVALAVMYGTGLFAG